MDILTHHFDVELSENADYVFIGSNEPTKQVLKSGGKIFIFSPGEAIAPDFNLFDYAIGFDDLRLGDRYLRHLFFPYSMQRGEDAKTLTEYTNRKFCNFIYQNPNAHPARDAFFKLLSFSYKPVDSIGKHLRNVEGSIEPRDGNWYQGSIDAKSKYKFSIAFENACHRGYTTEKIISSFQARTIPIYWGNPDVAKDLNPEAFINCHDFSSFDEVVNEVRRLDTDDDACLQMINSPKGPLMEDRFYEEQRSKLEFFLLGVLSQPVDMARRRPEGFWNDRYIRQLGDSKKSALKNIFKR